MSTEEKNIPKDIMQYAKQAQLLPCPFCGGGAEVTNSPGQCHKVMCNDCDATVPDSNCSGEKGTPEQHIASIDRAVEAWNNRTKY